MHSGKKTQKTEKYNCMKKEKKKSWVNLCSYILGDKYETYFCDYKYEKFVNKFRAYNQ
jgi:hypothetical protein